MAAALNSWSPSGILLAADYAGMAERRNYYRILGVQPDATRDVIRGAYRTLMQKMQMHPDLGGDGRTAALINSAWRILRDPQRRAAYDEQLLSAYDIRMIAGAGEPVVPQEKPGVAERRNYYRLLGVQPDAPPALIDSAYRTMRGVSAENELLLAEAYAVLSDMQQRQQYDAALAGEITQAAGPDAASDDGPDGPGEDYEPLIALFCYFCKTPHSHYPGAGPQPLCNECGSPLDRSESVSAGLCRSFDRTEITGEVTLFDYWPGQGWTAALKDLTPDGLRLDSRRILEKNQIVRVQARRFDAVARVVHCSSNSAGWRAGMTLLTVAFSNSGVVLDIRS